MKYPSLNSGSTSREMVEVFAGYNHNLKIGNGEWYDTKNLTTEYYPLFANRKPRGLYKQLEHACKGMIEKDALCYVENGTLYVNDDATPIDDLTTDSEKQLISMGAYIVIFPDKKYYNTADPDDFGSMEATFSYNSAAANDGNITFSPCNAEGVLYTDITSSANPPGEASNNDLWADTSGDKTVLKQWSSYSSVWTEIPTVYTKVTFKSQGDIPRLFKVQDGVSISGFKVTGANIKDLNGEKIIYGLGGSDTAGSELDDYIILSGLITETLTQTSGTIAIRRKVPSMKYVCECQNRLWGCYYGMRDGKIVNEIYCSALGDFKNWSQYLGVSTDSWRASVGSDGQWTGAVNYLGSPTFFKENHVHIVTVSAVGAHRVDEMACRGVQKGSSKSLQIINETLYYKSRTGVVAWQGGFPADVSKALGNKKYYNAVAGVFGERYYISMQDEDGAWQLFTYDVARGIWMHEDNLHAEQFVRVDDELFCRSGKKIWAMNGTAGDAETGMEWKAESGILYYSYANKKYVSRFNIRIKMEAGATLTIKLEYDSNGEWVTSGTVQMNSTGTATLPIRPRRCDHMRLQLSGTGDVRIYSIAKVLEVGSDV